MKPSRVASNSIVILASEIADRILRFVLVVFAARLLGDADYGKISFAIAFSSLFLILADFGMHQLLIREIARRPEDRERLMGNGLVLKILFSGFTALCIYIGAELTNKPGDVLLTVYIIGATQIVGSLAEYFSTVFQGLQQMKYAAIGNLILSASNTVLGVLILVLGGDFVVLAWVYLISRLLKLLYCMAMARARFIRIVLRFERPLIRVLILEGATFGILRFFSMMYTNVDSTMLSLMIGDESVGWYTAAYRLIFAFMVLPMGIMRAVYPALSAYFESDRAAFDNLFVKTFKLLLWTGTSMAIVVHLLAEDIVTMMFGAQYLNAAAALRILVWSTAIYFVGTTMTHVTRSAHRQTYTAKVVAASAILNLGLNFVLIPKYSLVGAAFATVLAEFFTFCFHLWFVSRYIVAPPLIRLFPRMALVVGATGVSVWLLSDFHVLIAIGAGLVLNILMLILSGYYSKEEFLNLRQVLTARREMR